MVCNIESLQIYHAVSSTEKYGNTFYQWHNRKLKDCKRGKLGIHLIKKKIELIKLRNQTPKFQYKKIKFGE